jgi:hypothetical protein
MTVHSILTHPGSAHKDEFLACSILVHLHQVSIVRREPTPSDLEDPATLVVDVGGEHDPARGNFDHHQFPKDHPPVCALSLVLQDLGLYEDARLFCEWLEPAEWFDCRGPIDTARKLGVGRELINQLNSPIDVTLLRRFAAAKELTSKDPLWQVMGYIGEDLAVYLKTLRQRLDYIKEHADFWTIDAPQGSFEVLFMPRTDPLPGEPSMGLPRFIDEAGKTQSVIGMIYPDRRGEGYGLSRHNDSPLLDFSGLEEHSDVHFAHARGFVAKTSATDPSRLRELLALAQAPSPK